MHERRRETKREGRRLDGTFSGDPCLDKRGAARAGDKHKCLIRMGLREPQSSVPVGSWRDASPC
jgi:hypothetical protein